MSSLHEGREITLTVPLRGNITERSQGSSIDNNESGMEGACYGEGGRREVLGRGDRVCGSYIEKGGGGNSTKFDSGGKLCNVEY